MFKTVMILATVIPYVIAIIIFIFGARKCRNTIIEWDETDELYKHIRLKSRKGKINKDFPLVIFSPIPIFDAIYRCITYSTGVNGIVSLAILFIGKLIIDYAFYFPMQPYQYHAGFYIALKPFKIGISVMIISILLALVKV